MGKAKQGMRADDLLLLDDEDLEDKIGSKANSVRSPLAINKRQSSGSSTTIGARIRGRTPPALKRNMNKQAVILEQAFISKSNKQAIAVKAMVNQKFDGAFQKTRKKSKKRKKRGKRKSSGRAYD